MSEKAQKSKGVKLRPKSAASMASEWRPVTDIAPNPKNVRVHSPEQIEHLRASLRQFGQVWPILIDADGMIVAHHGVFEACKAEGYDEVKVAKVEGLSPDQIRAFVVADNRLAEISEWDEAGIAAELEALGKLGFADALGYAQAELEALVEHEAEVEKQSNIGSLAREFGVPPFSILNAKSGEWQRRKDGWLSVGIRSELGRGENLIKRSPQELFCLETGMGYDKARKIVTDAIEAEGDDFDVQELIAKHKRAN